MFVMDAKNKKGKVVLALFSLKGLVLLQIHVKIHISKNETCHQPKHHLSENEDFGLQTNFRN